MSHLIVSSSDSLFVKKRELAARFGVSARTVDNWVARRLIPFLSVTPRLNLFNPDDVKKALAARFEVKPEEVRR